MTPILASCIKILVAAVAFGMTGLVIGWCAHAMTQEPPEEYKDCYGCMSGWCDAVPGSEECERYRTNKEVENEA